jgi:large subunit ribosomal protein L13
MKTVNHCYQAKPAEVERRWYVVDASDQVLGRLAVRIANVLMGKNKPTYTPHLDTGDFVIVLNAGRIRLTGVRKREQLVYRSYSGYPSGHKEISAATMLQRHPERVLEAAVRRMMPKNALARHMLSKLKIYAGDSHPHQAQKPQPLPA